MKRSERGESPTEAKRIKANKAELDCSSSTPGQAEESSSLRSFVGSSEGIQSFFQDTYQKKPGLYHVRRDDDSLSSSLEGVFSMGCNEIASLLEDGQNYLNQQLKLSNDENGEQEGETIIDPNLIPLFFRDREVVPMDEVRDTYGNSAFAGYLDGCSIIQNHADMMCPPLASLSLDLQKSFPHIFVNTYLTPPKAAAVRAHADDRDVFVIQIVGEKRWKVYGDPPIPLPYSHEQVGKSNLPVPADVLNQKPQLDITLRKGDILYIPRGYVHEACTSEECLSFHGTVAMATHDWSLSKAISNIIRQQLDTVPSFRMAVHPHIGTRSLDLVSERDKVGFETVLISAKLMIQEKLSVGSISAHLADKYYLFNNSVKKQREELLGQISSVESGKAATSQSSKCSHVVGHQAACCIKFGSNIQFRASTPEERESVPPPISKERGLVVREETCDALLALLTGLKGDTCKTLSLETARNEMKNAGDDNPLICDLTLLSFVRHCVEMGAVALHKV